MHGTGRCRLVYKEVVEVDQTKRNLTSGDLRIPVVVIHLGVTGLKKTRSCISWTCLREWGSRSTAI